MTEPVLRCEACGRMVTRPALTTNSRERGRLVWGSTCARRVTHAKRIQKEGRNRDTRTGDLFGSA